jgi:hypothetical protein
MAVFDRYCHLLFGGKPMMARIVFVVTAFWLGLNCGAVFAHDSGQWEDNDPAIREWYQSLLQPDVPNASCCGEADAYWCDDYYAGRPGTPREGKAFCKITDDRPDAPRRRPHIDVGTEFEIPPNKLKWDRSNPTGHGVLFLSRQGYVYCFVQPTGI